MKRHSTIPLCLLSCALLAAFLLSCAGTPYGTPVAPANGSGTADVTQAAPANGSGTADVTQAAPANGSGTAADTALPESEPDVIAPQNPSGSPSSGEYAMLGSNESVVDTLSRVHLVMSAVFTGETGTIEDGRDEFVFRVEKIYRGSYEGDTVRVIDRASVEKPAERGFVSGETYLLLLTVAKSVYYPDSADRYEFSVNSLVIPAAAPTQAVVYGKPLNGYLSGFRIDEKTTADELGGYFAKSFADNKLWTGTDFCRSDKLSDVLAYAEKVVKVKVGAVSQETSVSLNYECTVEACFKGDAAVGSSMTIRFGKEDVKPGDTVIAAVIRYDLNDLDWYAFAGARSFRTAESEGEIIAALEAAQTK